MELFYIETEKVYFTNQNYKWRNSVQKGPRSKYLPLSTNMLFSSLLALVAVVATSVWGHDNLSKAC